MRGEQSTNRQLFVSKRFNSNVDDNRLEQYRLHDSLQEEKLEERVKKVINPNIFREDLRRQQRDFRQSNHQYLKMCGIIARASRDDNKFGYIGDSHRKVNTTAKGNTNSKNAQKKAANVHLFLDTTLFNCALLKQKVPIKDLYSMFPFRKQSIIFQSHEYLSSSNIFFFYQNHNQVAETLRYKLESTIQEGIMAEFKSSINKSFKHIGFFDYLYFINRKGSKGDKEGSYPADIHEIAMANTNFLAKIDEDQKNSFNNEELPVEEQDTCDRLIICEESDVVDNGENLCFQMIDQYSDYKRYKAVNFKNQKIYEKDAIINTNIRNIISTEKIYLVEIIEEVKSYIELSRECEGTGIMAKVYEQITSKADEYLRLLCGYTESKILTIYNIENYQEKIYSFIEKSIRYKKPIRDLPQSIIKEFPVLQIWYKLPQNLLGYSREELHETFYQLMEAIRVFEQKMKASQFYESLKLKRPGIRYLQ